MGQALDAVIIIWGMLTLGSIRESFVNGMQGINGLGYALFDSIIFLIILCLLLGIRYVGNHSDKLAQKEVTTK